MCNGRKPNQNLRTHFHDGGASMGADFGGVSVGADFGGRIICGTRRPIACRKTSRTAAAASTNALSG
jgi:hypothetical protein